MKNTKNKEKERQVPIKNYILLIILFLASIFIVLYLCNWYQVYEDYKKQTPVIRGSLSEITTEEFDHYLMENPTTIVYMCTSADSDCRNFEKDFKRLVEKDNLQEDVIYLNLSDATNDFLTHFHETYPYKKTLTSKYPAFVSFEDGKLHNLLQASSSEKLTVSKAEQFIEINRIGE